MNIHTYMHKGKDFFSILHKLNQWSSFIFMLVHLSSIALNVIAEAVRRICKRRNQNKNIVKPGLLITSPEKHPWNGPVLLAVDIAEWYSRLKMDTPPVAGGRWLLTMSDRRLWVFCFHFHILKREKISPRRGWRSRLTIS